MTVAVDDVDAKFHRPRILCLHGGGTNRTIFRAQCRQIAPKLEPHYRLVYAEAPFPSSAGPDVLTVYADYGPFKRWLRWIEHEHAALDDLVVIDAIDEALRTAMEEDDAEGWDGEWVGLLGFSQGAKVAGSLLLRQQQQEQQQKQRQQRNNGSRNGGGSISSYPESVTWKFAVLIAGRAPLVCLDREFFSAAAAASGNSAINKTPSTLLSLPSEIGLRGAPDLMELMKGDHIVRIPTIHVHGLLDPGLHLHRELLEDYCRGGEETGKDDKEKGAGARLVEWNGPHRVPFKHTDVDPMIEEILNVSREVGIIR